MLQAPRFRQDCDRIEASLAALSTKLLSLARDDKEVALLLNAGDVERCEPKLPRRLIQALRINFKEVNFVSFLSLGVFVCEILYIVRLAIVYRKHDISSEIRVVFF